MLHCAQIRAFSIRAMSMCESHIASGTRKCHFQGALYTLPAFVKVKDKSLSGARELLMRSFICTSGGQSHATLQSLQMLCTGLPHSGTHSPRGSSAWYFCQFLARPQCAGSASRWRTCRPHYLHLPPPPWSCKSDKQTTEGVLQSGATYSRLASSTHSTFGSGGP